MCPFSMKHHPDLYIGVRPLIWHGLVFVVSAVFYIFPAMNVFRSLTWLTLYAVLTIDIFFCSSGIDQNTDNQNCILLVSQGPIWNAGHADQNRM